MSPLPSLTNFRQDVTQSPIREYLHMKKTISLFVLCLAVSGLQNAMASHPISFADSEKAMRTFESINDINGKYDFDGLIQYYVEVPVLTCYKGTGNYDFVSYSCEQAAPDTSGKRMTPNTVDYPAVQDAFELLSTVTAPRTIPNAEVPTEYVTIQNIVCIVTKPDARKPLIYSCTYTR